MYLGDNLLANGIAPLVREFETKTPAAQILLTPVADPEQYGVAETEGNRVIRLVEKPKRPQSNLALVGVYMFGPEIFESAKRIKDLTETSGAFGDKTLVLRGDTLYHLFALSPNWERDAEREKWVSKWVSEKKKQVCEGTIGLTGSSQFRVQIQVIYMISCGFK